MGGRVVLEKVRRPEPGGLIRPRLEERVLGADAGLALVVAPPGSGKTTLLAQVAALSGPPAGWYCVGPEDGSEAAFVGHLAHALRGVAPEVDLDPESVDDLIIASQSTPEPRVLVVDDVHEISGTPAEVALERFVRLRPRSLRILLGSRRTPAINTSRLLASGALVELGVDDLRFRSWEVEELYRRVYREPLSPEAAAALTRRTEGWAAGLQLFHLSTAGKERVEREAAVADLNGRSRLIRSYLTHNVIADLPADRRDFLMRTSTLGILTSDLCDELMGSTGSSAVLEDLERCHFFTTSIDDGQTFRYHQVLSNHLEVLVVDVLGAVGARELYARSAEILERGGYVQAALRAYARADEWGSVARLVRESQSGLAVDELVTLVGRRPVTLPREDPWIALSNARRLVRQGDISAAVSAFQQAEELAEEHGLRRDCVAERALISLWLPSGTPGGSEYGSSTAAVVRQATVRVLPLPTATTGGVSPLAETLVRLLAGQFDQARAVLARVSPGVACADTWEAACLRLVTVLVRLVDGSAEDPTRTLEELGLTSDLSGHAWIAKIARGVQSCVLTVESGGPAWSGACTEVVHACQQDGDAWGEVVLGLVAGIALVRRGEDAQAVQTLEGVAATAESLGAPVLGLWASALASIPAAHRDHGKAEAVAATLEERAQHLGVTGIGVCTGLTRAIARASAWPSARAPLVAGESGVELICLGGLRLRVERSDVSLTPLRPRARTLLQLLAVHHGHEVHREYLIDVLWPATSLEVGAHRLHVAASSVRRLLAMNGCGEAPLQRHGDAYRLDLPGVLTDVARFEVAQRVMAQRMATEDKTGALEAGVEALSLYAGDLLPELGPAEWVVPERERLRVLASSVAIDVARLAHGLGRLEDGRRAAQRAVEIDPLRDTAWLLLAEHQEAMGEPSAAAMTRREHLRVVAVLDSST